MPTSTRKDLRTAESEWRGMSTAHRNSQHTKPVKSKPRWTLLRALKLMALLVVLVIIGKALYDSHKACESRLGENHILCTD